MLRILNFSFILLICLPFMAQVDPGPVAKRTYQNFRQSTTDVTDELLRISTPEASQHPDFGRLPKDAPCNDCYELVEKRTADKRVFARKGSNGNTQIIQKSYGAINYRDEDGNWRAIDPTLQPTDNPHIFIAPNQPIPTRMNTEKLSSGIKVDGHWVDLNFSSFRWMAENESTFAPLLNPKVHVESDRVESKWEEEGISMTQKMENGGIKTNFELLSPNAIPPQCNSLAINSYISVPYNFSLVEESGEYDGNMWRGSLLILDEKGNKKIAIGTPLIYDAAGNVMKEGFGYQIHEEQKGYGLMLSVDAEWLQSPNRKFPIIIDPLVVGIDSNQAAIGFEPSNFCFDYTDYCSTDLTVTVPGESTIISATSSVRMLTFNNGCSGSCDPMQAGFRIYGPCSNRYVPNNSHFGPNSSTAFDYTETDIDLFDNQDCRPPQCNDYQITYEMRTYSCSCPTDVSCGTACHVIRAGDWRITVEARTLEAHIVEGDSVEVCYGETVSFNSDARFGVPDGTQQKYDYFWTPDNVNTVHGSSYNVYSDTFTTLTVTDQCGNKVNDTTYIDVQPLPDIEFPWILPSCQGQSSGEATAEVNNTEGPFTYAWSTSPMQTTQTATNLAPGKYYVTVTSGYGCEGVDSVVITNPPNALDISVSGTDVTCNAPNDGSATVTINSGNAPYNIQWNNGATSPNLSSLYGGHYSVTVTDDEGCVDTGSYSVQNPGNMEITVTVDSINCNGSDNGSIEVAIAGDNPPFIPVWNTGDTTDRLTGLGPGTYTLTVTDDNNCNAGISVILTEPEPLQLSIESFRVTCEGGGEDGVAVANVNGGTEPYSYFWNSGPNQYTDTATNLSAGSYGVSVTDANGCVISGNTTILPPAQFTLDIDTTPTSCNGSSDGSVTVNISGGQAPYEYQWNTSSKDSTKTVTGLSAGFYTVTITDATGCPISTNVKIRQPNKIQVNVVGNPPSCPTSSNGKVTVYPKGGTPPYSYQWNYGTNETDSVLENVPTGVYELYITDSKQCKDTFDITVPGPDSVTFSTSVTDASCSGNPDGRIIISYSGGRSPLSLKWEDPLPDTDTVNNVLAGTYAFTITDGGGCQTIDSVTVENTVDLNLTSSVTNESCPGAGDGSINTNISGGTPPYNFLWSNDSTTNNLTNLSSGIYKLTVTDANDCSVSDSFEIISTETFSVNLGEDVTINRGKSIILQALTDPPGDYSFEWTPVNGLADSSGSQVEASPNVTTTYIVRATSPDGCFATDTIVVAVVGDLRVAYPNAFSPNGDGLNDLFFEHPTVEIAKLIVYDRWGNIVYQGNQPWNGNYANGTKAPLGMYVFRATLRYPGTEVAFEVKGNVVLVR